MLEEPVVYHETQNPQFHQPHASPATYAHNPFAPPHQASPAYQGVLATRGQRLLAQLIDSAIIILLLSIPLGAIALLPLFSTSLFMLAMLSSFLLFPAIILTLSFGWIAIKCYFLYTRGQSPGKMLLKIRIVSYTDHTKVPGLEIVLLRTILPLFINLMLFGLFTIIDICFIFRDDHRCLHDLMAKTTVIQA